MYRAASLLIVLALFLSFSRMPVFAMGSKPSAPPATLSVTTNDDGISTLKDALKTKLPIVLELGSDTCHYCVQMKPIMEELRKEYKGRAVFLTLDVYQNMDMAKKFNVTGIPAFIFYDAKGASKGMVEGAMSKGELLRTAKSFGIIK